MRTLVKLSIALLHGLRALFRSREEQAIIELALRQQLAVYAQKRPRPRLSPLDRAFWVTLSRLWPQWRNHLVVVRPETVVRWHREGFRRYWQSISTPGPGRPRISEETKAIIVKMATENCWRARKIQAELMKIGVRVSLATVSRYVTKTKPDATQQQRWRTFLRNHKDVIAGMDLFVVPTVRFRLLYVWFAIDHGRRRILHFNVTANPSARWVIQQLRETFPNEPIHQYLIYDNDSRPTQSQALGKLRFHERTPRVNSKVVSKVEGPDEGFRRASIRTLDGACFGDPVHVGVVLKGRCNLANELQRP